MQSKIQSLFLFLELSSILRAYFYFQIIVHGNKSEASDLVGKDNYYIIYQVKVTPFNIFGLGPTAQNDSVYSAEESKLDFLYLIKYVQDKDNSFFLVQNLSMCFEMCSFPQKKLWILFCFTVIDCCCYCSNNCLLRMFLN